MTNSKSTLFDFPSSRQTKAPKTNKTPEIVVNEPINLNRYLPYRILTIANKFSFTGKVEIRNVPLSSRDWRLLLLIASKGPSTNQNLAKACFMDTATVSRAVSYLKSHELISTRRSKLDRRSLLVGLTQEGGKVYDEMAKKCLDLASQLESHIDADDLAILFRTLDKIDLLVDIQIEKHESWDDLDEEND